MTTAKGDVDSASDRVELDSSSTGAAPNETPAAANGGRPRLLQAWIDASVDRPGPRAREFADAQGVPEAELIAARCGYDAVRLELDAPVLLAEFEALGRVMALTRNEDCVIESIGTYRNVAFGGPVGQVLGDGIDLRVFLRHWKYAFAVEEETARGPRRSFQFFGPDGTAMHKTYLREESDSAKFDQLRARFLMTDPDSEWSLIPAEPAARTKTTVDPIVFRSEWSSLQDTHEFQALLRRHDLDRLDALRLAGEPWARQIDTESVQPLLERSAKVGQTRMVFVGSRGCIQIHTGPIQRIVPTLGWLNILDPEFNLHLKWDRIGSVWRVVKPTSGGPVTSIEIFSTTGELIALFFGDRKHPEEGERAWVEMLDALRTETGL